MGWEMALWALLNYLSTQEKNRAYNQSKSDQAAIRADNETKRLELERISKGEQDKLLEVVDKDNVTKDSKVQSQRIADLMGERRSGTPDAIVSKNSPQIVKDAMNTANNAVTAKVNKQGLSKAALQSLTGQFEKYADEFGDANTTAQNVAGKLKGNEGVMNIGMREASDPYSAKGDFMQNLTQLLGMYAMSKSGKGSPEVVDNTTDGVSGTSHTSPRRSTYDSIYTA
jgi:hypothetical protein